MFSNAINGDSVSLGFYCPCVWGNNKDFSFSPLDLSVNPGCKLLILQNEALFFSLIAFSGALLTSRRGEKN